MVKTIKRTLMIIILASTAVIAQEAVVDQEPKTIEGELKALSQDMAEIATKLRSDRADGTVQVDQRTVSDRLQKLIKEIENADPDNSNNKSNKKPLATFENEMKKSQSQGQSQNANSGAGGPPSPTGNQSEEAPKVTVISSKWTQLPTSARDEIMQAYGQEIPLRWRSRIEAYFLSVAAEETKKR